jgi:hypothetical protein
VPRAMLRTTLSDCCEPVAMRRPSDGLLVRTSGTADDEVRPSTITGSPDRLDRALYDIPR